MYLPEDPVLVALVVRVPWMLGHGLGLHGFPGSAPGCHLLDMLWPWVLSIGSVQKKL